MTAILTLLVWILILGLVVWVAIWAIDTLGVPEPINRVGKVLIVVLAVILLITQAFPMLGVSLG